MRAFELRDSGRKLVIFDIDDTLLHTTAKIKVIKNGQVVRSLTNQEFNNYKLQPGEEFDFGEFRNAAKFEEESVPIGPMLDKLKDDLAAGHDVVMLTARADFDDQKAVWRTFKRHGIDINRDVHLYRAGNLPGDASPANKKAVHVNKWLSTGEYNHVTMYDDSEKNLFVFKGLQKFFPKVEFEAHHVSPEGETKQIEEAREIKKDVFIEMFKKFLPLAMQHIGLDSLPRMVFLQSIGDQEQPTFGRYVNDEKALYVALANRHPNDILRTIAHELTHYKQDTEHELDMDSGETGSPHENEANAVAGIVMRHFNKAHPEYLKVKPVVLEGWSDKYKRSINCSNPKGFSQRAHCQGRKKKNEAVEPHEPGYQHDILTMPANTLVIDTPGELDWYKIGQHFPNLGKEDPHEYGQSESDMVINFATREEMIKFAKIAKRLGFNIKSIGGSHEHPEIHSEKPFENFTEAKTSIRDQILAAVKKDGGRPEEYFVRFTGIDKLGYSAKQSFGRSPDADDPSFDPDYIGTGKGKPALWFYPLNTYLKEKEIYASEHPYVWLVRIKPNAWLQTTTRKTKGVEPAPAGKERVGMLRLASIWPAAIFFKPAYDVVGKFYDYGSQHQRHGQVKGAPEPSFLQKIRDKFGEDSAKKLDELNVTQTLQFIKQAHGDQLYGKLPYWTHPRAVALTGKKIFGARFNSDAVKTAFLHDVVEDTHIGLDELSKMDFSPQVIEAVGLLTKDKTLNYSQNIEKIIASGNPLAMMVKYADNYENYTGDKSDWDPKRAASSQKKYLMSLNMLGDKLGVKHHIGENFADGKKPGRKGLAKRVGVNCKQPVSKLRSIAKKSSGERQRMAHWCANMKSGKK